MLSAANDEVPCFNGYSFRPRQMAQDVENDSIRIDHEEATNAPGLVSKWIYDLEAACNGSCVHLIHIVDLDAHARKRRRATAIPHDADLGGRIARRHERHHEAHVHRHRQAEEVDVEGATFREVLRLDIWDHSSDAHRTPFAPRFAHLIPNTQSFRRRSSPAPYLAALWRSSEVAKGRGRPPSNSEVSSRGTDSPRRRPHRRKAIRRGRMAATQAR